MYFADDIINMVTKANRVHLVQTIHHSSSWSYFHTDLYSGVNVIRLFLYSSQIWVF